MSSTATLLLDTKSTLGEGPIWDIEDACLWWINIEEGLVHRFDPATNVNRTFEIGQRIGTVVRRAKGGLVLAAHHGLIAFDPESEELTSIADPESDKPTNRFNDGKCDPAGRLWAGTLNFEDEGQPRGALYSMDANGSVKQHLDGICVSNGIVWTSDAQTMYYIDSPTRKVDAFDFDNDAGVISHRRTAVTLAEGLGYPDGMAIDSEDKIWVALWDGWGVARFDPSSGDLLEKIDVPTSQVTACAFGGPNLDDLYITTARRGLADAALEKQPAAGGLFHVRTKVRGVPSSRYAG